MWQTYKFGELVLSKGTGLERKKSLQSIHKKFPYIKMNNINKDNQLEMTEFISVDANNEEFEKFKLNKGDFLFNTRNSYELVGKSAVYMEDQDALFNNNILRIVFKKDFDSRYINYFLTSSKAKYQLDLIKSGTTNVSAIYFKDLKDIEIQIPPLSKQKKIVAKLDIILTQIDSEISVAEKKITEIQNLKYSFISEIFRSDRVMRKREKLGNICEFRQGLQVGKILQKEKREEESDVRFLRIIDFTQTEEPPRYIKFPGERYLVNKEDVSLVRYGTPGFVCRGLNGVIANNLFRVIPKTSNISNEFLYWFLKSPSFQEKIGDSKKGVAIQAISFGSIKDIEVLFPSLSEQQRMVSKLDAAYREFKNFNVTVNKSIEKYALLKALIISAELKKETE